LAHLRGSDAIQLDLFLEKPLPAGAGMFVCRMDKRLPDLGDDGFNMVSCKGCELPIY